MNDLHLKKKILFQRYSHGRVLYLWIFEMLSFTCLISLGQGTGAV